MNTLSEFNQSIYIILNPTEIDEDEDPDFTGMLCQVCLLNEPSSGEGTGPAGAEGSVWVYYCHDCMQTWGEEGNGIEPLLALVNNAPQVEILLN